MNDPKQVVVAAIFIFFIVFVLTLISSWLTILSLNVLFAKEIIALTIQSVFSLAWIKMVITGMLSGIVRITHQQRG
jgi:hypothetical protein